MTKLLEQTLHSLEQLPDEELDELVTHALKLRAGRNVPHLSADEARMLEQIHHAIPNGLQARFDQLLGKRDARTLTTSEHAELLRMTDEIEHLEARRITLLGELARYRGVTLETVMHDLGITTPGIRP